MTASRLAALAALPFALALGGCASTPQATPARDAEAKAFGTHPGHATVYVYRPLPESNAEWDETVLYLGSRLIGATLPQTYYRIHVEPGRQLLRGIGVDQGALALQTEADALYFVELRVSGGVSSYRLVNAETGKRVIRECCALLENWAPGQRPLLR